MYEHSQAILAHEQNQSSSSASVTDGQGQRQVITPGDLASAFASLEQRGSTSSSSVVQPPSRTTTPASSSISQASGPISQSSRRGVITPSMLNQALVNTSSSATPRSGLPHPHRQAHGRTPRRRYEQQVLQSDWCFVCAYKYILTCFVILCSWPSFTALVLVTTQPVYTHWRQLEGV